MTDSGIIFDTINIMTRKYLVQLFILFALLGSSFAYAQHNDDALATDILRIVNEHRAKKRLPPLTIHNAISAEAERHSHNMATGKIPFGHEGFDERMERVSRKVTSSFAWAENVASGPLGAEAVVDLWLHSPGHKKNIEGNYNLTGIGISKNRDGELYFTQIFVRQGR
jgi:uncharacterized protein YkwD